ncbi:MAG: extracellular solute-binding protein [Rhodobacteraceae bacterium]|nr:extracellular solute-binding protein [Paracoccaceae bacterium]
MTMNRRKFLATTAATTGAAALSSVGTVALAQDRQIRHFWWGNPERDRRTFGVIDVFNGKHDDIEVIGETLGFGDYFQKLTTQVAGGNMPDVIQQGYGIIFEYIERGAILPLDEFVGNTLDVSNMDQSALDAGTFNGQLYAISIGANSHMALYNTEMYAAAGISAGDGFDPFGWTYDDVKRIGVEVAAANEGKYGTDDNTGNYQNFSDYIAQNGVEMFNADGEYQVTAELVIAWWELWKDIREAGATPAGKASAGLVANPPMAEWGVVSGNTATSYVWSNQLVGAQALVEAKLGAAMFPNTPAMVPGSVVQPSQFVCLTRDTVDAEAATTYMSAFVNDPDMTDILGLERGIPANSVARAALQSKLSESEAASVAFFDGIRGKTAQLPPPAPSGANEIEQTFQRAATGVLLDQDSIAESAANFVRQAAFIRRRAG